MKRGEAARATRRSLDLLLLTLSLSLSLSSFLLPPL